MAIKMDMKKAYYRLGWEFISKCFTNLGFSDICIATTSFKIPVNGKSPNLIYLERCIR